MAYVLAFLQALPALVSLGEKLFAKLSELVEVANKLKLEQQIANDIQVAKSKGDTSGLEKLLGRRTP